MNKYQELVLRLEKAQQLQDEIVRLRMEIQEDVKAEGGKVENEYGMFLIVESKNWQYSPSLIKQEEIANRKVLKIKQAISDLKTKAQRSGRTPFEISESLRFVARK